MARTRRTNKRTTKKALKPLAIVEEKPAPKLELRRVDINEDNYSYDPTYYVESYSAEEAITLAMIQFKAEHPTWNVESIKVNDPDEDDITFVPHPSRFTNQLTA